MSSPGDVIDLRVIEGLRALGGGDDTFLAELIATFLTETPQLLGRLRVAVADIDAGAVRLNAHSLKGSSAEFGAAYLAELCRQMEQAGKAQELDSAADLLAEIEDEYHRVAAALSKLIDS